MKTNLSLGTADIVVLVIIGILLIISVKLIWGFFHEKPQDKDTDSSKK